jgi:hypothetical protein
MERTIANRPYIVSPVDGFRLNFESSNFSILEMLPQWNGRFANRPYIVSPVDGFRLNF